MSESEAAVLNTDRDCPDGIKSTELVKENKKWRKKVVKGDENSCSAINRLAIKLELKSTSEESGKNKIEYSSTVLHNGNANSPESFVCSLCRGKFLTEAELESHAKSEHSAPISQPPKPVKPTKVIWERMHYLCFSCNGRPFLSKSSLHRHIAQHVTLPEVRLSRLKEDKNIRTNRSESPEEPPSGRPQVALKRVTVSCHGRTPLKFLFKLTSDPTNKDTFKVVKSTKGIKEGVEDKVDGKQTENKESFELRDQKTAPGAAASIENQKELPVEDSLDSFRLVLEEDQKESGGGKANGKGVFEMVEASHDQCSVTLVEEPVPDSPKGTASHRESEDKAGASEVIYKEIMRPSKNGEGDMDKIQSSSPSVVLSPAVSGQLLLEKNGLSSNNVDVSEEPEFIPLERLDQGTAAQIIEKGSRESVLSTSHEKEAEATILCEACGESVPGDQTALEDHCLCRGHYKCPVCSVACASSDALAVHTEETHHNKDNSGQKAEKKKKSGLRSVRRKHQEPSKDLSIDSNSEISLPSPPCSENSNSMPSVSARTTETSQPAFSIRISEVTQQAAKTSDRRMSPPSQPSTVTSPVTPQAGSLARMPSLQNAPIHTRVPETIPPPPLTRPPNLRNMESQPRGNVPNVSMGEPMQPPPALYKMPTTTSHGMTGSQMGLPTVSTNMAYPRGIPASGYQTEAPSSVASNLAATMSSRYQAMHPGYPTPGQAPSYPPYPPSMQMQRASMMQQQRFQMGPPPPYTSQMLHSQGPRVPGMSQEAYLANSQQAYNQSLLKAHLEQARLQGLPQSAQSAMLQSMQTLQQEHYQQQQLQKQLFQQQNHQQQMMQAQQPEQTQGQAAQVGQKRKSVGGNTTGQIRYQHQNALNSQQTLQNQLQQNSGTPAKQRRLRENIGIPSKQTDSDCEIIAVQQRGEGVPVIQSIQGANTSSTSAGSDSPVSSGHGGNVSQATSESTIHLTDSITLSVRQPPGVSTSVGSRSNNASAVASILATRGITVTPASGSMQQPRTATGQQRSRPSPPPNRGPAVSPPQPVNSQQTSLNSSVSISHSSRQPAQHSNDGFAVPAPVGPAQRQAPRQIPPDRPPRPPTVDLTDENASQSQAAAAATVTQCRLCDKQFPSVEALKNHMQIIHQTRNYFKCTVCNTKHSSQHALANHMKRVHKFSGAPNPAELVIPLVDLRSPSSVNRLNSLGIRHVISLSQLGMNSETGSFCIPIMSLDNTLQQRGGTMGGLIAMGTTAVLPIGPVKNLPSAQAPPQPVPQTVPAAAAPPPLAPIRPPHQPNQYMQPTHQMPPR